MLFIVACIIVPRYLEEQLERKNTGQEIRTDTSTEVNAKTDQNIT